MEEKFYTDEAHLEQKFLFRLIKVAYVIAFLFLAVYIGILGWSQKPYKYIDTNKSYVTCLSNNNTYTYSTVDDYINKVPNSYELNLYDQKSKANYLCERVIEDNLKYRKRAYPFDLEKEIFSEYDQKWYPNTEENRTIIINNVKNKFPAGIYKLNNIYSKKGSWSTVVKWWILGFVSIHIVLNLIKEILLYVFLGKEFSWKWLKFWVE